MAFFGTQQIVRGHLGAACYIEVVIEFVIGRKISIDVILIVAAQPFFHHKPGVMVTLVFRKHRFRAYLTLVSDALYVWCIHVPICAGPNRNVI
jgi:hypothetical protein